MKIIKYAIIGFGGIAESRLAKEGFSLDLERFKPNGEFCLVGVTDVNPERRSVAEALGLKWYESAEEIVSDDSIDAVVVATNNCTHAELGKLVMEAGKHCFIEKPLATTLEEACELKEIAENNSVVLSVDHMMSCNAYNRKAENLISSGELGVVNDMHLHMEFYYGSTPEERDSWRCSKPEELGGPIGDVGSHCLYMAEFLSQSEISEISAVYYPQKLDLKVENGAFINFKMKNGITGSASVSFASPRGGLAGTLSNLGFEIYGSDAICRSYGTMFQFSGYDDDPVKLRLEIDRGKEQTVITIKEPVNVYQEIIREHAMAINNGKTGNAESGIRNMKLLLAVHESAKGSGVSVVI